MPNAIYPKAKEAFENAQINLLTDTIKVALVGNGYVYGAAHQYYSDLGANVIGAPVVLAGKGDASGVFSAGNVAFTGLNSTATAAALVIYKDTGTSATSPLIAYIDTASGLPRVLDSQTPEVDVTWDTGANKIFTL